MIDKIIEFADKNAKSVIVVLLGVIAAGGISGGLYIKNLQDSLKNMVVDLKIKDELIDDRMQALKGKYEKELRNQGERITLLQNQAEILRKDLPKIKEAVDILNFDIKKLYEAESSGGENSKNKILATVKELSKTTDKLDGSLKNADMLFQFAQSLIIPQPLPPPPPPEASRIPSLPIYLPLFFIILLIIIWSSIFYIIGKKRGKKINKLNN